MTTTRNSIFILSTVALYYYAVHGLYRLVDVPLRVVHRFAVIASSKWHDLPQN